MIRQIIKVLLLILVSFLGACRGGDREADIGPPFFPDDRGTVSEISVDTIQLEGGKTYPISSFVRSFSTYKPDEPLPLLQWRNRYVHLGLDGSKTVIWIAGIGVVDKSVDPPVVFYTNGAIKEKDRQGNLIFQDGTVFKLAEGVSVPEGTKRVTVMLDANEHKVFKIVEQPS